MLIADSGELTTMASATSTDDAGDIAVVHHTETPEVNELLCFVQQKATFCVKTTTVYTRV